MKVKDLIDKLQEWDPDDLISVNILAEEDIEMALDSEDEEPADMEEREFIINRLDLAGHADFETTIRQIVGYRHEYQEKLKGDLKR